MNRSEALETILRLLPSAPGADPASARERLEALSSGELNRMADYLLSSVEQRPATNIRRMKWEQAQAHVRGLADIQPLLADWSTLNERASNWLAQLRSRRNDASGFTSAREVTIDVLGSQEPATSPALAP